MWNIKADEKNIQAFCYAICIWKKSVGIHFSNIILSEVP